MSTGEAKATMEGDLQIVPVNDTPKAVASLPPKPPGGGGSSENAIVEYTRPLFREEEEDLEVKLRRIIENVPVRVSNTSGSSAGSGSGDFHQACKVKKLWKDAFVDPEYGMSEGAILKRRQYRQMRRKEQDRLARMEADYQRRKEVAEFNMRREQRLKAAEERTAKKRLKRQKKKERKKEKKTKLNADGRVNQKDESSDSGDSDNGKPEGEE
ncbi:hypothetical protein Cgig2_032605 [Carnegiea gigantea]|uniref:PRKR-interacting protein 1 n=1 Tax=Carnegiea gigantea TaxID=171969 RepID=A0A9Q1KW53_9CARY|nr:hypothetical protein Cgig2_032605 [Carnegiea gigantea]